MSAGVHEIGRLLRLKDQRLQAAERVLAAAVAAVRAAEAEVARRDAAIAELDARRLQLDRWFVDPPADPRLIAAALVRREFLADRREAEAEARRLDVAALEDAEAERAEAARAVARAQARRDATDQVLDRLRRALAHRQEAREELEFEERLAGAGGLA